MIDVEAILALSIVLSCLAGVALGVVFNRPPPPPEPVTPPRLSWPEFRRLVLEDRPHHTLAWHALMEAESEGSAMFVSEGVAYRSGDGWVVWPRRSA